MRRLYLDDHALFLARLELIQRKKDEEVADFIREKEELEEREKEGFV